MEMTVVVCGHNRIVDLNTWLVVTNDQRAYIFSSLCSLCSILPILLKTGLTCSKVSKATPSPSDSLFHRPQKSMWEGKVIIQSHYSLL